jgi:hypothetical protein
MNPNLFSPKDVDWKQFALNFRSRVLELDVDVPLFADQLVDRSSLARGKYSRRRQSGGPATTGGGVDMRREAEIMLTSDSGVGCPSSMREVGEMTPSGAPLVVICLHWHCLSLLTLIIDDMKRIFKKVFKSKKLSLRSIHGPGPATSTSTPITSSTDLMPSIPAASAQVTAGVSVSVQLRPLHL